jgi:hypothetical protein
MFAVTILRPTGQDTGQATGQDTGQDTGQATGQDTGQAEVWIVKVLEYCREAPRKSSEIQGVVGIQHRETFQRNYLDRLLKEKFVQRTIPKKPSSPLQQYKITKKGMNLLKD